MTANPLKAEGVSRAGKVTTEMLHDLAASLNSEWWVKRMGRRYGVSTDEHGKNYLSWSVIHG